ncbi:MAG TPA: hypothetical protein PKE55_11410 [Kiritimatiellia bacterium]|nr:hypothetical protein [Kiritimatiellia bacterium]
MIALVDTLSEPDALFWAMLPQDERDRLAVWESIIRRIDEADRKDQEVKQIAAEYRFRKGFSVAQINRRYYAFKADGLLGVTKACYRAKFEERPKVTKHEIELFRWYMQRNQRCKFKPAHRQMIRDLHEGAVFDHIGSWLDLWRRDFPGQQPPPICPHDFIPKGWSYSNFMLYKLTKFEQVAASVGRQAARNLRPLVFTTRVGLEVMQYVIFDDVWHDAEVNLLGVNRRSRRPLELAALDLYSAHKFAYGLKPMIQEGDKWKQLTARDMLFLVAHVLCNIGYRPGGTIFVLEHGTACLPGWCIDIIRKLTAGMVDINQSGIDRRASIPGLYDGPAKGNPNFKAALESRHALSHNEMADQFLIPGQTGKDRNHAPEESAGRSTYNETLIRACAAMPEHLIEQIRWPITPFHSYANFFHQVTQRIEDRTNHTIEGFEQAGLVKWMFRLSPGIAPLDGSIYDQASPEERAAFDVILRKPGNVIHRLMSPREVFETGRPTLKRLPHYAVPMILGPDGARPVTVGDNAMIVISDEDLSIETLRYTNEMITPSGRIEILPPGTCWQAHVNPFDPRLMYISKSGRDEGAFLGVCKLWETVSRADLEEVKRMQAESAKFEGRLLRPLARRGAAITRAAAQDRANNAHVVQLAHAAAGATAKPRSEADDIAEISVVQEINNRPDS